MTKQKIEEVKKEALDLRKSIEFTENVLEEKVNNTENKLVHIDNELKRDMTIRFIQTMSNKS